MSNFKVGLESSFNRTTTHPYQLHFVCKTKVEIYEDHSIEKVGLSLTTIGNICRYRPDYPYLVG
jgi:hypothetical protein